MARSALKEQFIPEAIRRLGVFVTDPSGLCSYVSDECAELMGLSSQELLGQFWFRCLESNDRKLAIAQWENQIRQPQGFFFSGRLHKDIPTKGSIVIQAQYVLSTNGQPSSCVGIVYNPDSNDALYEDAHRYERLREALETIKRTETEAVKLYSALNESEATITALNDDLLASKKRNQELTSQVESLASQMRTLEEQLGLANSAKYSLEKEIESLHAAQALERGDYAARVEDAKKEVKNQILQLEQQLLALKTEQSLLQEKYKSAQDELASLHLAHKADTDAARFVERELTTRLQNIEHLLEREKTNSKEALLTKEKETEALKQELNGQLNKMLSEASDLLSQKKSLSELVRRLEEQLEAERTEHGKAIEENAKQQSQSEASLNSQINGLELELAQVVNVRNAISEKLSDLEKQRDHDLACIEKQRRSIDELQLKVRTLEKAESELKRGIADSEHAIRAISNQHQAEEDSKNQISSEFERVRAENQTLIARTASLEELLRRASSDRESLADENRKVRRGDAPTRKALALIAQNSSELLNSLITITSKASLSVEQSQAVAKVKASAEYAQKVSQLAADVLAIETNQRQIVSTPFSPRRLLSPILARSEFQASQREIQLDSHIINSLPEIARGDSHLIELILNALVSNIIEALPANSHLELSLDLGVDSNEEVSMQIVLHAKDLLDTAITDELYVALTQVIQQQEPSAHWLAVGLMLRLNSFMPVTAEAQREKDGFLFKLSFGAIRADLASKSASTADSHQQKPDDQLKLEKQIVNTHIELPTAAIVETALADSSQSEPKSTITNIDRIKVLVAEDNGISQRAIKAVLEKLGCEVVIAINGRDVVEKLKRDSYALILMDTQMPQVDGLQATEQIRTSESTHKSPQLPIFGMSAHIDETLRTRCLKSGMNDLLSKPLHESRLEQLLGAFRPPSRA